MNQNYLFIQKQKKYFRKIIQDFENKKLVQKDLAKTLKLIAQYGRDGFYLGSVAEKIHTQMQLNGGLITKDDLENYQPVWRIAIKINL